MPTLRTLPAAAVMTDLPSDPFYAAREMADRARAAQQVVNEMGFGPTRCTPEGHFIAVTDAASLARPAQLMCDCEALLVISAKLKTGKPFSGPPIGSAFRLEDRS